MTQVAIRCQCWAPCKSHAGRSPCGVAIDDAPSTYGTAIYLCSNCAPKLSQPCEPVEVANLQGADIKATCQDCGWTLTASQIWIVEEIEEHKCKGKVSDDG